MEKKNTSKTTGGGETSMMKEKQVSEKKGVKETSVKVVEEAEADLMVMSEEMIGTLKNMIEKPTGVGAGMSQATFGSSQKAKGLINEMIIEADGMHMSSIMKAMVMMRDKKDGREMRAMSRGEVVSGGREKVGIERTRPGSMRRGGSRSSDRHHHVEMEAQQPEAWDRTG